MMRLSEVFMRLVSCNNFRVSARTVPVPGLSVMFTDKEGSTVSELYDGSECTEAQHVDEHRRITNPATTDSDGRIAVCLPPGRYNVVVGGAGMETQRLTLSDDGKLTEDGPK